MTLWLHFGGKNMRRRFFITSRIRTYRYHVDRKQLIIEFKNSTARKYFKVPREVFEEMDRVFSKQKYYEKFIKYVYRGKIVDINKLKW